MKIPTHKRLERKVPQTTHKSSQNWFHITRRSPREGSNVDGFPKTFSKHFQVKHSNTSKNRVSK